MLKLNWGRFCYFTAAILMLLQGYQHGVCKQSSIHLGETRANEKPHRHLGDIPDSLEKFIEWLRDF